MVATWEIVNVFYSKHRNCMFFLQIKVQQAGSMIRQWATGDKKWRFDEMCQSGKGGVFPAPFWWAVGDLACLLLKVSKIVWFASILKPNEVVLRSILGNKKPSFDKG